MAEGKVNRPKLFRYSIRTLLFITLFIAGSLAGYPAGERLGWRAGSAAGSREREDYQRRASSLKTIDYPVGDLISPANSPDNPIPGEPDYSPLIALVTGCIDPFSWDDVGGPGLIAQSERNSSLTVTQSPDVHEKIRLLLVELRKKPGIKAMADAQVRQNNTP